jgi:CHAD domain-containing protein
MAYRLQSGEAVPAGLRRIACEELSAASSLLQHATARTRDDAIHEARKSVKKVRAILRLMKGELGQIYEVENGRLCDLARRLSVYRDATVMIETLDQLHEHYKSDPSSRSLASIRLGLVANRQRLQRGSRMTSAMRRASDALLAAAARASRWRLLIDGPVALAPGMKTAYSRGRKAMASVRRCGRRRSGCDRRRAPCRCGPPASASGDVADAGAGGDAGNAGVGDHGHVLAERSGA